MVRGSQKEPIETVEPAGILVACHVEVGTEVSRNPDVNETRAERLDEAGIT